MYIYIYLLGVFERPAQDMESQHPRPPAFKMGALRLEAMQILKNNARSRALSFFAGGGARLPLLGDGPTLRDDMVKDT